MKGNVSCFILRMDWPTETELNTMNDDMTRLLGVTGLYLMDAAAWVLVAAYLGICYRRILKQKLTGEVRQT